MLRGALNNTAHYIQAQNTKIDNVVKSRSTILCIMCIFEHWSLVVSPCAFGFLWWEGPWGYIRLSCTQNGSLLFAVNVEGAVRGAHKRSLRRCVNKFKCICLLFIIYFIIEIIWSFVVFSNNIQIYLILFAYIWSFGYLVLNILFIFYLQTSGSPLVFCH